MVDSCFICGEDIYPDDENCDSGYGQCHIECAECGYPEGIYY